MNDFTLLELPKTLAKSNYNLRWFLDNRDMLLDKFPNKFVVIEDGSVIDSSSNLDELLERLKTNEKYSSSSMIELINVRANQLEKY
jgi:hypothetical protein